MSLSVSVRDATADDIATVTSIYEHYVLSSKATFEESPPNVDEMLQRREAVLAFGGPYVVAVSDDDGSVVGYAYAGPYRTRIGYRFTCENAVYVRDGLGQRGVGCALMRALIDRCESTSRFRQMIAVIGDSQNVASVRMHEKLGFVNAHVLRSVGFKFGQWIDVVVMQRALGDADRSLPGEQQQQQ